MTDNGPETCGELIYRALAAVLKSEGLAPATALPSRIDALDEDERLVLAFLLARRAPPDQDDPQRAPKSVPAIEVSEAASDDQAQFEAQEDRDLAITEDTSTARPTEDPADLTDLADPTDLADLPAQDATDDATADTTTADATADATADTTNDATASAPDRDDPAAPEQEIEDQAGTDAQGDPSGASLPDAIAPHPAAGEPGATDIPRPTPPDQASEAASETDTLDGPGVQEPSKDAAAEAGTSGADATPATSSTTPTPTPTPTPKSGSRDLPQEHQATEKGSSMINGTGGIPKVGPDPRPEPERLSLPNGRTNTDYAAQIDGYADIRLRDDNGAGLTITPDGRISGAPMPAGDYKLILGATKGGRSVEVIARLSVIPRPQDLWKALPSDQEAKLAKPDEASELLSGHGLVVAASKRGRSHAQEGSYRDDHFEIDVSAQTGWHILIVADGAGSAPLSREGSKVAAQSALATLRELLPEALDPRLDAILRAADDAPDTWRDQVIRDYLYPVLPEAAFRAAAAIEKRGEELDKAVSDLSTTLIIAIAKKLSDRWFVASFTLGDGGVALYDSAANSVEVMCRPDSGEYAGQTRFLTTREFSDANQVSQRIFVNLPKTFTALFALTDGITDPKFPTDSVFSSPEAWATFWHKDLAKLADFRSDNPDLQQQLLDWLDFWSRGNHDDRTLAVLVPLEEVAEDAVDPVEAKDAPEGVDTAEATDAPDEPAPPVPDMSGPPKSDDPAAVMAGEVQEAQEEQAPAVRPGDRE